MSSEIKALAGSTSLSNYVVPPLFPADQRATIHEDILNFLHHSMYINMSSIDPGGWPTTHCMHFVSVGGNDGSLIVYSGTQPHTRKLVNLEANPRMSIVVFKPEPATPADKASYLRLYALTSILRDGEERIAAWSRMCDKPGYESTRRLKIGVDPFLRFDVILALWEDRAHGKQAGTLDYAGPLRRQ